MDSPALAIEIFSVHLNQLGLILPTEPTSASIASAVAALRFGTAAPMVPQSAIDDIYQQVKTRIKQVYKREPLEFITSLPQTPAALLRQYPTTAKAVYNVGNLPVVCPLNQRILHSVQGNVKQRGGKAQLGHDMSVALLRAAAASLLPGQGGFPMQAEHEYCPGLRLTKPSVGSSKGLGMLSSTLGTR